MFKYLKKIYLVFYTDYNLPKKGGPDLPELKM